MGYLVERVARAVLDRRKLPANAEVNWDAFMSDARAALAMTADWIEQRYGSLHPGAVCIRHELSAPPVEQAKTEETVTSSCGCIFCDLALAPVRGFHAGENGEPIKCPLA